ncbi:MAG: hypothetical protein JOY71_19285 [Acetobacteraceae bacterium]|nr:hypothetical protein [Acetobacteraceae bacterium]
MHIFNPSHPDNSLDELCAILQHRADKIKETLSSHFSYAPVKKYLRRFSKLHKSHLSALRQGKLLVAHEILLEIHELSYELSHDEFWAENRAGLGNVAYLLGRNAFEDGPLISSYMTSPLRLPARIDMGKIDAIEPNSVARVYENFLVQNSYRPCEN